MKINKIYKIDVLEGLKQLEDNSIDCIITSPPYNKNGLNSYKHRKIKYDAYGDNMNEDYFKIVEARINSFEENRKLLK